MPIEFSVAPLDNSPGYLIYRVHVGLKAGLLRAFREHGHDFTAEQWGLLSFLWEREGVNQSELAQRACKDRHNVTRMLKVLEKRGLIRRKPDTLDLRCFKVFLTARGRALQAQLTPIVLKHLQKAFAGLGQQDLRQFMLIQERILQNLASHREEGKK